MRRVPESENESEDSIDLANYVEVHWDTSVLDGRFTSTELRRIADKMDRAREQRNASIE